MQTLIPFPHWLLSRYWPVESRRTSPFTLDKLVTGWLLGTENRNRRSHAKQD